MSKQVWQGACGGKLLRRVWHVKAASRAVCTVLLGRKCRVLWHSNETWGGEAARSTFLSVHGMSWSLRDRLTDRTATASAGRNEAHLGLSSVAAPDRIQRRGERQHEATLRRSRTFTHWTSARGGRAGVALAAHSKQTVRRWPASTQARAAQSARPMIHSC